MAKTPHFAHHHRDACGGGPETALHKLAKQIVKERLTLFVPKRIATHGDVERVLPGREEIALGSASLEFRDPQQIVPDLYVTIQGRKLFVEIAVTHPCDDEKIRRIREHGIPAIEIDLSRLPRDATPEVVANAVIRSAPRKWLFNKAIDDAVVELQKAATAARVAAESKLTTDAKQKARAYATALDSAPKSPPMPAIDVLRGIGLDKHIGIPVAGFACFTTGPAYWQSVILSDVLYGQEFRNKLANAVAVSKHLGGKGLIRPEFKWISNELETASIALDNRFAAPWRAVESYLKYLARVGVVVETARGFAIAQRVASQWFNWVDEEIGRVAAREHILETIERILDQLPDDERKGMTVDDWMDSINPENVDTYASLLEHTQTMQPIEAELRAIVGLFNGTRTDVLDLLGLPIAKECERRLAAIAAKELQRKAEAAGQAEKIKIDRQKELAGNAATVLGGSELDAWLNTPHPNLDGRTPLEAAYHGYHSAGKAREILSAIERRKQAEHDRSVEATFWREKLRKTVALRLREDEAKAFLNDRDDDYSRATALVFCRDERTYRIVLQKLDVWINAFGSKRHVPF
ncbi:MbcA/ParS/Xre antitoxin family protein [Mesorhizobium sp. LMG 17147]|uniref:antitoxin Xre/MbcA/ParS toxin-binding domain-containing protein n=1 Tax=Mesorhizobium sp. LMG 17147 TaxID=2963091 RepID=UPI0020C97E5A|nr:antitoxin Xre/MbcA/ParS toxin-binding domain-containing protein [Mesorhizobium sp. LMG 17147]MCP9231238.1 MbcA/ParS/Xre antitoxin family protein [Mesorhizobium sp. LMG 17147]